MSDKIAKRGVSIFIDGKAVENSVRQITSEMKQLESQQKKMTIGSDEYIAHGKKIAQLKSYLQEHRLQQQQIVNEYGVMGKSSEGFFSKAAGGFNKYFAMATAAIASLTGIAFGAKQVIDSNAELSDSFADVMKTTGLTTEEVNKLYKEFKSLNTRTPRSELLKLASDAGKLGIEGRKNILDFVDAGNQINVALGEDLGEDAIKNIGKMVGVFDTSTKELQGLGLKEQMLAVGSAVNSIGQSSSASEPYLVSFAGRIGGISKQAGIGIDQILGYASALDQNMQQVEMSATALSQFIVKMMSEPAKFAKMANMEVSEFSSLLKTDANEAMKLVLKTMNDKGGFQEMVPLFEGMGLEGTRAIAVITSLAGNLDKVEEAQKIANEALIDGNSVTKEYDIRNNNLAASLSKLSQNVGAWFKNSTLTEWLGDMVGGLEEVTRASKSATEQFDDQSKKVISLVTQTKPLLDRYDDLIKKSNRSATENNELKRIISEVTSVMPGAASAFDQYGKAIGISTSRVREFIQVEIDRLRVVNKDAIEDTQSELDKINEKINIYQGKINEIKKTGSFTTVKSYGDKDYRLTPATQEQVSEAVQTYQKLISERNGYEAEIKRLNGSTLEAQLKAAEDERARQEKQAQEELKYYAMSKAELKKFVNEKNELAKKIYEERFPVVTTPTSDDKVTIQREKINTAMKNLETENLKELKKIKENYLSGEISTEYDYNQKLLEQQDKYDDERKNGIDKLLKDITDPSLRLELTKQIEEIDKKSLDREIEQNNKIKKIILDADPIRSENEAYDNRKRQLGLFNKEREKMTADELLSLEVIEAEHKENLRNLSTRDALKSLKQLQDEQRTEETLLSEQYSKGELNKKVYEEKLLQIELDFLRKKLAIQGLSQKEIEQIMDKITNITIKNQENSYDNYSSFMQKYQLDEVGRFKAQKDLELQILQEYLDKGTVSEQDAAKVRAILASEEFELKTKSAKESAQEIANISGNLSSALQGFQAAEEKKIETKYQKQIDAASDAGKDTTEIEKKKNEELAALRAENADAIFAVQVAGIIATTAVAAINAFASASNIPIVGPVLAPIAAGAAVAYGMSQLAQANAAREAAKEGYYTGGFTGPGGKYDAKGVVHANEFVANSDALTNPHLMPLFKAIDYAQRMGTVSGMKPADLSRALRVQSYDNNIPLPRSTPAAGTGTSTDYGLYLSNSMAKIEKTIDRLNSTLDDGIEARSVISGSKGSFEQTKKYEKLISNASRK